MFGELTFAEVRDLFLPGDQSPLVQRRRALLIISRVRVVAAVFTLLTPLWIPIDLLIFEPNLGAALTGLRVLATVAFVALAMAFRHSESMASAHRALAWLLSIPTVFFLVSVPLLGHFEIHGDAQQVIAAGYAFLPFVMVAGLSVFPITALEGAMLAGPLWMAKLAVTLSGSHVLSFSSNLGALWLLALLAVVATLAGMSQLHFMMQLVSQASHDGLTRAYTRRVGEELLDLQFNQAARAGLPLTVAFIDLDDFKGINDRFGHEEGDDALRRAATALRKMLRRGDILVRWGGEEFVVVMPGADSAGAMAAIARLREAGLGDRPDGARQTASMGVAERLSDGAEEWETLVDKADQRMYVAKQSGKDRVVCREDEVVG
ncbi:MAG: GGDEF domain-containing protein [Alphaproteobacteria bacterium]|nr:GGDEF domain-containing protein [Alphaproteobacteria bacterium]